MGFSYGENTMLMDSYGVWWSKDSIWKGYGGQILEHTGEGYFWLFNLVESKNSLVGFWCSKDFIGVSE